MTLPLAILIDALASVALLGGLGYVISRATLLTPHLAATADAPRVARSKQHRSRDHRHAAATVATAGA